MRSCEDPLQCHQSKSRGCSFPPCLYDDRHSTAVINSSSSWSVFFHLLATRQMAVWHVYEGKNVKGEDGIDSNRIYFSTACCTHASSNLLRNYRLPRLLVRQELFYEWQCKNMSKMHHWLHLNFLAIKVIFSLMNMTRKRFLEKHFLHFYMLSLHRKREKGSHVFREIFSL